MLMKPVYNLPDIQFVGGSFQNIRLDLKDSVREDFADDLYEVNFSLTRWGCKGNPVLSKKASLVTSKNGYRVEANLLPAETVNLHGKFIYQITISDDAGYVEIPGRGILDIVRNINPEVVSQASELVVSLTIDGAMAIDGNYNADNYIVDYTDGVLTVTK